MRFHHGSKPPGEAIRYARPPVYIYIHASVHASDQDFVSCAQQSMVQDSQWYRTTASMLSPLTPIIVLRNVIQLDEQAVNLRVDGCHPFVHARLIFGQQEPHRLFVRKPHEGMVVYKSWSAFPNPFHTDKDP